MSVIGVDIDGTLATGDWVAPDVLSVPDPYLVHILRGLREAGHTLCTWSCRADYVIDAWLRKHGIRNLFDYVNESPNASDSAKPDFDYYIGDDAIQWPLVKAHSFDRVAGCPDPQRDRSFTSQNQRPYLAGVGRAFVDMFEEHWKAAWRRHTFDKPEAFMTICSHAKPYSKSHIHASIRKHLYEVDVLAEIDYIHISNAGIVPASAEMTYPFNAYDWDGRLCDEATRKYHVAAITRRVTEWSAEYADRYSRIVCYLREGGNTIGAVRAAVGQGALPNLRIIAADPMWTLPYVETPDPDDCLAHPENLGKL